MTQRDRRILSWLALGLIGLVVLVMLAWNLFVTPLLDYNRKIAGLTGDVNQVEAQIFDIAKDRQLLERARKLSLPANTDRANEQYANYLRTLLLGGGLEVGVKAPPPIDVKAPTAQQGKKPGHVVLAYQVEGKGTLAALASALEKLQRTPVLHRVKDITLDRTADNAKDLKDPRDLKLRIKMTIEAMIVHGVGAKHDPVLEPNASIALPSDKAPRQYAGVGQKNVFVGPLPPPPLPPIVKKETPPATTDDVDVREFVQLVSTTPTSNLAHLRNRVAGLREITLMPAAKGLQSFTIWDEARTHEVVKGKVLRVDQRDVFFMVHEDAYAIHIGETLARAMRRPLSDEELTKVGLLDVVNQEVARIQVEEKKKLEEKKKKTPTKKSPGATAVP